MKKIRIPKNYDGVTCSDCEELAKKEQSQDEIMTAHEDCRGWYHCGDECCGVCFHCGH